MKINLFTRERRSPTSIAIAVVANAFLVAAIGAITFHFPLSAILGTHPPVPAEVHLNYLRVAPAAAPAAKNGQRGTTEQHVAAPVPTPERVAAPTTIPTAIPPVAAPPASGQIGIPGGTGTAATNVAGGTSSAAVTPLTGITPAVPDHIQLQPTPYAQPKSMASRADSAVQAAFGVYRDSVMVAKANPKRAPGDWTTTDRNGQKWGWDPAGIHIAGFTIPNVIFAALPLKIGPVGNLNAVTDARMAAWTQKDIFDHQQQMSDADFKAAIKRIRDREDREHNEQQGSTVIVTKPPQP